ncbi:hypothetical protein [Bacillus sp. FSL K6-3431]
MTFQSLICVEDVIKEALVLNMDFGSKAQVILNHYEAKLEERTDIGK